MIPEPNEAEDWVCRRCGREFSPVGDRTEPTDFCDPCAHIKCAELAKKNERLRQYERIVKGIELERQINGL